jgi:hypothetical protein
LHEQNLIALIQTFVCLGVVGCFVAGLLGLGVLVKADCSALVSVSKVLSAGLSVSEPWVSVSKAAVSDASSVEALAFSAEVLVWKQTPVQ